MLLVFSLGRAAGQEDPVLTIAAGRETIPYYFATEEGEPAGWLVDLWRLWSAKTGTPIAFKMGTFAESLQMVRNGEADVHIGCFRSDNRDVYLDFGVPMCELTTHLFHHVSIVGLEQPADVQGFQVGGIEGDYAIEHLRENYPQLSLTIYPDNNALFEALAADRIKVFVKDTAIGIAHLRRHGLLADYRRVGHSPLYRRSYHLAVAKGRTELLASLNEGMQLIGKEERQLLEARWMDQPGDGAALTIACPEGYRPFSFRTPDLRPAGLLIDIWRIWAGQAGRQVQFRFYQHQEALAAVANGSADFHVGQLATEATRGELLMSVPVYPAALALFYSTDSLVPPTLDGLDTSRAGVTIGSYAAHFARQQDELQVIELNSVNHVMTQLADGSLDVAIVEHLAGEASIQALGLTGRVITADQELFTGALVALVNPAQPDVLAAINDGLLSMSPTMLNQIESQWVESAALRHFSKSEGELALTAEQTRWLREHYQIRLGVDPGWEPFEFVDSTETYQGMAADVVRILNSKLGLNMKPVPGLSWNEVVSAARRGDVDVIPCLVPSPEREKYLLFTDPYLSFPLILVAREDHPFVSTIGELGDGPLVVVDGYITDELVREHHPEIERVLVETTRQGLERVSSGQADVMMMNLASFSVLRQQYGLTNLKVAGTTRFSLDVAMGVRRDWPELVPILNEALASITPTQHRHIHDRWIRYSEGPPSDWRDLWRTVIISTVLILLLLITIIGWNRRLSREVDQRKQAEERNLLLLESVSEGIFGIDAEGRFTFANSAAESMLGYSEDELLGHLVHPRIHYAHADGAPYEQASCPLLQTCRQGTSHHVSDEVFWRKDGSAFAVEYMATPIKREEQLVGAVVSFRDLTDLVTLNRDFVALLENTPDFIYIKDEAHRYTAGSQSFAEFVEHEHWQDLMGKTDHDLFPKEVADASLAAERQVLEEGKVIMNQEEPYQDNLGQRRWLTTSKRPLRGRTGKIIGVFGISKDITALKELTLDLEEARDAAEEANAAKSEFLARMSHEIRTPMNAIIGMSHLALDTELNPKQQGYLQRVYQSAHALLGIINDILDFSKIEAGKMTVESIPFRLDEVLHNLSNVLSYKAEEKGLELLFDVERDVPRHLVGDPLRLGQVLMNLCSNAIKFTESGEVVVSIRSRSAADDDPVDLEFAVSDTGIGIREDQIRNLFQSFSQADGSTTRRYGGTGLGLAICRRLVELMKGDIRAESTYGEGSIFTFTIPVKRGPESDSTIQRLQPILELRGIRTLVVEDNETARAILENYLGRFRLNVSAVGDGQEALDCIRQADEAGAPFELALLDWRLPNLDGLEIAGRLKQMELRLQPRLIMVTAYGHERIMDDAEAMGFDGFLIKPVTQSQLLDAIMHALGHEPSLHRPSSVGSETPIDLQPIHCAHVLLVEDNEINRDVAVGLLQRAQLQLEMAANGQEALACIEQAEKPFDLVLMDVQMPIMDGMEATRRLRQAGQQLPIIAMTANALATDRDNCLAAGMTDYLAKPIEPDRLFQMLVKWIQTDSHSSPTPGPEPSAAEDELQIPGIDTASGLMHTGGNADLYRKLLRRFVDKHGKDVRLLESAIAEENLEEAVRQAHTLKGVAGNLGMTELQAAASRLETLCSEKQPSGEAVRQLDQLMKQTLATLAEALPAATPEQTGGTEPIDSDRIQTLLAELSELLETDYAAAQSRLEDLLTALQGTRLEAQARKLAAFLDDFDTDSAQDLIITMQQYSGD